jgi:hypothetical protein
VSAFHNCGQMAKRFLTLLLFGIVEVSHAAANQCRVLEYRAGLIPVSKPELSFRRNYRLCRPVVVIRAVLWTARPSRCKREENNRAEKRSYFLYIIYVTGSLLHFISRYRRDVLIALFRNTEGANDLIWSSWLGYLESHSAPSRHQKPGTTGSCLRY